MGKHVPLFKEKSQTNKVTKFDKKESRRAFGMDIDTKEVTAVLQKICFTERLAQESPSLNPLRMIINNQLDYRFLLMI